MLYVRSPKGDCCSISDDLSCSTDHQESQTNFNSKLELYDKNNLQTNWKRESCRLKPVYSISFVTLQSFWLWGLYLKRRMPTRGHCWKKNSGEHWARTSNIWITVQTRSLRLLICRVGFKLWQLYSAIVSYKVTRHCVMYALLFKSRLKIASRCEHVFFPISSTVGDIFCLDTINMIQLHGYAVRCNIIAIYSTLV